MYCGAHTWYQRPPFVPQVTDICARNPRSGVLPGEKERGREKERKVDGREQLNDILVLISNT